MLTAERWIELDRPRSVRRRTPSSSSKKTADDSAARDFAERLAAAVRGAPKATSSSPRQSVPREGHTVTAERLPPCTPDGRNWDARAPPGALRGTFDRGLHTSRPRTEESGRPERPREDARSATT